MMNAILLAGGKSKRFGKNKALLLVDGKPLISVLVDRLKQAFDNVYVSLSDKDNYSFLEGVFFIKDIFANKGPMAGLQAGLLNSNTEFNYLCACDMPFIEVDYFEYLKNIDRDYDILVPEINGRYETLASIYRKTCIPYIERKLESNQLRLSGIFDDVKTKIISQQELQKHFDPKKLFFNINYSSDYDSYLAL